MSFNIKKIRWSEYQIETPILLQDVNGACPLISIVNTLLMNYGLLQADVILNDTSILLEGQETRLAAVTGLRDRLAEKSSIQLDEIVSELIWLLVEHFNVGNDDENSRLVEMLPALNYGLNVDPDITNGLFGNELGTHLFDIFGLKLRHGWIVDPASDKSELVELADELKTYDKIQDYLVGTSPSSVGGTFASKSVAPTSVAAAPQTEVIPTASTSEVPGETPSAVPGATATLPTKTDVLNYPEPTIAVSDPPLVYTPYSQDEPSIAQEGQTSTKGPDEAIPSTPSAITTATIAEQPSVSELSPQSALPGPTVSEPEATLAVDDLIKDHESPTGKLEFTPSAPLSSAEEPPSLAITSAPTSSDGPDYKKSVLQAWLNKNSTQLTSYGLASLREQCNPGEFMILFRNNHFSTVYKRSDQDLYVLITDSLLQRQIVWQSLNSISGTDDLFFDGEFVPFVESEELQDYLLTKNLQEQEDAQMAQELQRRFEKSSKKPAKKTKNEISEVVPESSSSQPKLGSKKTKNTSKDDSKCTIM